MSALTLPGSIPGLLRRGSPVNIGAGRTGVVGEDPSGCTVILVFVEFDEEDDQPAVIATVSADRLALDLTDATGRAHAAWWLAGEVGAAWVLSCDGFRRWELHGGERPRHSLSRAWQGVGAEMRRMGLASSDWVDCPALDALDPDDPRLLPDGSRWVDAEALRRVCLHVAGVTP